MQGNAEKFEKVKETAEITYKAIGEVYCPYLKDTVAFNAKGLDHIKFKQWDRARNIQDQYVRLRLIEIAPRILKDSHTLQDFFEINRMERQKINSRWEVRSIKVTYYGFIAILNGHRVKVIVKEVAGGKKFFWSLIPFWKTRSKPEDGINKKILHEGDLETD